MKTQPLTLLAVFSLIASVQAIEYTDKEAMEKIIAADAKVTQLGTDMKFTEGPVWIPGQMRVVFSDIPNSRQMEWTKAGGLKEYRKVEASNGNLLDLEGNLLSCQHSGRNVISTDADGKITVVVDKYDGKKFNSPNDIAIKSDGTLWFTDPSYGLRGKPAELDGKYVYRFDPKSKKVELICRDFDMPNGIAFSPDEKRIYIADTGKYGKINAYDVPKDGGPLGKPVFVIDIRCDGMCIDTSGNIYTTSRGGIHVFNDKGKKIGMIPVPEQPANVCFGGENYDELFITAFKSLYHVPLKIAGAKPKGAKW